jgi:hypothetical protein
MDYRQFTAPCGTACFNCELFEANLTPDLIAKYSVYFKLEPDKVSCKGCREMKGCRLHWNECATLDCVNEKGVEFCYECDEFPCTMFNPAADRADKLPHNIKLFNLCRIKKVGIDKWAMEESVDIRNKYFKGIMIVGKGPVLE